ncbi:hypothetical protein EMCRGX_G024755 [Ephydatia muelleri]
MANVDESKNVSLVLRVKRRSHVDPADALVVSKKRKIDPSTFHEKEEETNVFRLAGTVGDVDEETLMSKIRQHTTDHRALTKHNPLAKLTMSAIHDRQREEAKTASLDHRFQFVSKLRHLDEANQEVAEDSLLNHAGDKVQIYDVILGGTPQADSGKAVITCNNAVMIREQVAPRSNPSDGGGDYVYDLYCADEASMQDISTYDWSSLTVYEPEYVHDVIESEDGEEDDDDSNAEDNWRNDYPDEDEWKEDEGEGPQSSASDDDVSTNQAYRGRAVPLMLDYDELRNNGDDSYENGDPVMSSGYYHGNGSDEEKD